MAELGPELSLSHSKILAPKSYSTLPPGYFPSLGHLQLPPKPSLRLFSPSLKVLPEAEDSPADCSQRAQWHRCHPLASATAVVSKGNNSCSRWSHLSLTGARTCIRTRGPTGREQQLSQMGINTGRCGICEPTFLHPRSAPL